jgi:beta-phosphoglucomutase
VLRIAALRIFVVGLRSGQTHQTVNLTTYVFGGSNPPPTTIFTRSKDRVFLCACTRFYIREFLFYPGRGWYGDGMKFNSLMSAPGLPAFSAVIFDMDGVLCDSEPFIAEAACRMFKETHGLTVTPADFEPFIGTGEDRFLGGVAEKYGAVLELPRDKIRTYAIYLEIIQGALQAVPGVKDFVAACREAGLKTAVATSADRVKMNGNLAEIGLPPESFDACVTGDDIRRKKPDPEIFLTAARMLGVPPAACLVVEDAVNGVQAAKAAGCACFALSTSFTSEQLLGAGADLCSSSFSEDL